MKKIFFTMVAIAAIAACTKSEVQYEQSTEIGLAPVTYKATKAAESDNIYNQDLPMYVFANTYADETPTMFDQPYFQNALFTHRTNGEFGGDEARYYWPNVKTLVFAGLSKSGNVNNGATPKYEMNVYNEGATKTLEIELEGYAPGYGGDNEGDNDLMWFPTTAAYSKQEAAIGVTMKHACAWVTIKISGDETTGVEPTETAKPWNILDVKFEDLSQLGNVVLGNNADWTDVAEGTEFPVYAAGTGNGKELTTGLVDYTKKAVNNTYTDLVVVPQSTKTLYIKYKYTSDPKNGITFTETKAIPLNYNGNKGWEAGYHYTYNITIGTEEILVKPDVKTWETPADTNIEF